jgi:predicted dinucleotide-binding enzyme
MLTALYEEPMVVRIDATAKATVAGLSRDIGFDGVDAGPLSAAAMLKSLA